MNGKAEQAMTGPLAKPAKEGAYTVRLVRESDAPVVRRLFAEVFDKPMSQALWDWKYAHPAGHGILAFQDGEAVAHYGGIGRDALWKGERIHTVQICDVMVARAARRAVRGNSALGQAVDAFVAELVGYGKRYLIGFGFPSDRHMRLAEILGLYAPVGGITETSWPADQARLPSSLGAVLLTSENFERNTPVLERLWRRMAHDLADRLVGIRDAAYLRRRYLEHPAHRYEMRLLRQRLTRRPLGLVVLRHDQGHSLLMDLVGPLDQLPRLLDCARAFTRAAGNPEMKAWCSSAFADVFRTPGARQERLPITVPTNISAPGPDPASLRDQWWLSAGDTDFQ